MINLLKWYASVNSTLISLMVFYVSKYHEDSVKETHVNKTYKRNTLNLCVPISLFEKCFSWFHSPGLHLKTQRCGTAALIIALNTRVFTSAVSYGPLIWVIDW